MNSIPPELLQNGSVSSRHKPSNTLFTTTSLHYSNSSNYGNSKVNSRVPSGMGGPKNNLDA
jgi:hypothetical protein